MTRRRNENDIIWTRDRIEYYHRDNLLSLASVQWIICFITCALMIAVMSPPWMLLLGAAALSVMPTYNTLRGFGWIK